MGGNTQRKRQTDKSKAVEPQPEVKQTEPFVRAMVAHLSRVVCELAATRAETVARMEHAKPAKDRKPLLLTPLSRVEEGKLMEFASSAADVEREACLEIAARMLAPDVLAAMKKAIYDERSPRAYTFTFGGENNKWFLAGFEPELALAK